MADYSCEWCDKDKTCPYAYNSTSCEQKKKHDDFKNIPSEIIDLLNKTKSEMTKLKDKGDHLEEEFGSVISYIDNLLVYEKE